MAILILVLVTLAIIALVLAVVAMKLIRNPDGTSAAPVSPPPMGSGSGAGETVAPKPATPKPVTPPAAPAKPKPVPKRSDGEMESFDISVKASKVLWTCPACGAENSYGTRCQICAENRT